MTLGDPLSSPRWYVVRTKPKQEQRAEMNLCRMGLQVLFPKLWEGPSLHDPRRPIGVTPLFDGYIFARFDAAVWLSKVRNTRGVHAVVGFGESATPVEDSVIDLIRARIHDDGFVHVTMQPGQAVEIVDGPLQSFAGVFERELRREDRVLILLTAIHGSMRVQLPASSIRPVPACHAG
jgi:transcriptional antiterminator RfaH